MAGVRASVCTFWCLGNVAVGKLKFLRNLVVRGLKMKSKTVNANIPNFYKAVISRQLWSARIQLASPDKPAENKSAEV